MGQQTCSCTTCTSGAGQGDSEWKDGGRSSRRPERQQKSTVSADRGPGLGADDRAWASYLAAAARESMTPENQRPSQPAHLAPGLYLSGLVETQSQAMLRPLNISAVLCMAPDMCGPKLLRSYAPCLAGAQVTDIDAHDGDARYNLFATDMPIALQVLEQWLLAKKRVLVHCFAGMNRSSAVCAAWIMLSERRELGDVVRLIARKRGLVLQNQDFLRGLANLARAEGLLGDGVAGPAPDNDDEEDEVGSEEDMWRLGVPAALPCRPAPDNDDEEDEGDSEEDDDE